MRVWFDCEFTSIEEPALLSVGLVAENGCECYVELLNEELRKRSNEFVLEQVLPLFGRVPDSRADDYQDLCSRIEGFLLAIGGPVELLYDYKADRELAQHALKRAPRWAELQNRVDWRNVAIETSSDRAQEVMEAVFHAAECVGLGRHHALVDARALRMAHLLEGCE